MEGVPPFMVGWRDSPGPRLPSTSRSTGPSEANLEVSRSRGARSGGAKASSAEFRHRNSSVGGF